LQYTCNQYDVTMPSMTVRDIDPETYRALKRLAAAHHRSLQGEVLAILVREARGAPPPEGFGPMRLHEVETDHYDPWGREEMYGDDGR